MDGTLEMGKTTYVAIQSLGLEGVQVSLLNREMQGKITQ